MRYRMSRIWKFSCVLLKKREKKLKKKTQRKREKVWLKKRRERRVVTRVCFFLLVAAAAASDVAAIARPATTGVGSAGVVGVVGRCHTWSCRVLLPLPSSISYSSFSSSLFIFSLGETLSEKRGEMGLIEGGE